MTGPIRFTALYVAGFVAFSAARGDRRILAYLAVIGAAAAAIAVLHRRRPIDPTAAYALSACGLLHLAGGLLPGDPVFYETWIVPHILKYDQLVHFTITAIVTTAAARALRIRPLPAAAIALAAGLGNEAFEYLSSLRFAGDVYVGGRTNAGWDLVFNSFGAATAGVVLLLLDRGRDPLAGGVRLPRRVHVGVATAEGDQLVV
jgi:hypothetical protein